MSDIKPDNPTPDSEGVRTLQRKLKDGEDKFFEVFSDETFQTDKNLVKLELHEFIKEISKKYKCIAPFGILVTLIATLSTAVFQPILGIDANVWQAIFVITTLLVALWLLWCIGGMLKSKSENNLINKFITKISRGKLGK
ncbi:MAG: hypothetical protein CVT49_01130 [candidate division Zixibacteria bacterium HGW-Zixibacteria-1]|nr:MAG: hypothetical protein CVT49_01130 [candidate division Zixibacteria bacterium HGW-Zixibacteria-1]